MSRKTKNKNPIFSVTFDKKLSSSPLILKYDDDNFKFNFRPIRPTFIIACDHGAIYFSSINGNSYIKWNDREFQFVLEKLENDGEKAEMHISIKNTGKMIRSFKKAIIDWNYYISCLGYYNFGNEENSFFGNSDNNLVVE